LCLDIQEDSAEGLEFRWNPAGASRRMSGNLPALTGVQVIRALQGAGFEVARIRGSHHYLRHEDGRSTVIPVHSGETIGPGLLRKILRDCELDKEQLRYLL